MQNPKHTFLRGNGENNAHCTVQVKRVFLACLEAEEAPCTGSYPEPSGVLQRGPHPRSSVTGRPSKAPSATTRPRRTRPGPTSSSSERGGSVPPGRVDSRMATESARAQSYPLMHLVLLGFPKPTLACESVDSDVLSISNYVVLLPCDV